MKSTLEKFLEKENILETNGPSHPLNKYKTATSIIKAITPLTPNNKNFLITFYIAL